MSDTWPSLPSDLQLSAVNCEQRMQSYFNYLKNYTMFHLEINTIPSRLNTSPASGAAGQLAAQPQNEPHYDGVTLENMRDNPLYQHYDDIDKIGLAQKKIIDSAKTIKSNAKKIRAFNDMAQKMRIPSQKK